MWRICISEGIITEDYKPSRRTPGHYLIAFFKHTLQYVSLPRCFEKDLINADLINSLYLEIDSDNELKKKGTKRGYLGIIHRCDLFPICHPL